VALAILAVPVNSASRNGYCAVAVAGKRANSEGDCDLRLYTDLPGRWCLQKDGDTTGSNSLDGLSCTTSRDLDSVLVLAAAAVFKGTDMPTATTTAATTTTTTIASTVRFQFNFAARYGVVKAFFIF